MTLLQRSLHTIGGMWELMRIGARARMGGGSAYWNWRRDTAFGTQHNNVKNGTKSLSWRQRWGAMLRFGAWVSRMKRVR